MPFKYKIDVLSELKTKGYSTYRLRKDKILGERVIQQIRNNEMISWNSIEVICKLLSCDVGDIVTYTHENDN